MQQREEWRCYQCGRLLGVFRGDRIHIRTSRSSEYLVGLPVTATCQGCGALNEHISTPRTEAKGTAVPR
jgi:hypothetical protein